MGFLYLSIESGPYTTSGLPEVLSAVDGLLECLQKSRTSRVTTLEYFFFYRRTEYYSTGGIIGR